MTDNQSTDGDFVMLTRVKNVSSDEGFTLIEKARTPSNSAQCLLNKHQHVRQPPPANCFSENMYTVLLGVFLCLFISIFYKENVSHSATIQVVYEPTVHAQVLSSILENCEGERSIECLNIKKQILEQGAPFAKFKNIPTNQNLCGLKPSCSQYSSPGALKNLYRCYEVYIKNDHEKFSWHEAALQAFYHTVQGQRVYAHLATGIANTTEELQRFHNYFSSIGYCTSGAGGAIWLGGVRASNKKSQWLWIDRSLKYHNITTPNWASGEPNNGKGQFQENCIAITSDSKWNDMPCNTKNNYAVEYFIEILPS